MFVGSNEWCPATATGDLNGFCVDSNGEVINFDRTRHVVPEMSWHLHDETPEFKEHGGVVRKGCEMVLALPDGSEILLLLGIDDMLRIPTFKQFPPSSNVRTRWRQPSLFCTCTTLHVATHSILTGAQREVRQSKRWWASPSSFSTKVQYQAKRWWASPSTRHRRTST